MKKIFAYILTFSLFANLGTIAAPQKQKTQEQEQIPGLITGIISDAKTIKKYSLKKGLSQKEKTALSQAKWRMAKRTALTLAILGAGYALHKRKQIRDFMLGTYEKNSSRIHQAVEKNDINEVKKLIKNKIDIQTTNWNDNSSPLHVAAEKDNTEIAELLLNAGVNIEAEDVNKNTPLHVAVSNRNYEITRYLLEKGANPNAYNHEIMYPLHLAAQNDSAGIIKDLLDYKANINAEAFSQNLTPLAVAAKTGSSNAAKVLIDRGAEIKKGDLTSPMMLAAQYGNTEILNLLHNKNNQLINDTDNLFKQTPLHRAVNMHGETIYEYIFNNKNAIKKLVDLGADKTIKDSKNKTAYDIAKEKNLDPEILELLNPNK